MQTTRHVLQLLIGGLALVAAAAQAADLRSMYSPDELDRAQEAYGGYARGLFHDDLVAKLPPAERDALAGVDLLTDYDPPDGTPFWAGVPAGERTVVLPIRTVRFLDDLSTVTATLERRGCGFGYVQIYVAKLSQGDEPAGGWPDPREAFAIDDRVYGDAFIKGVSNKLLGSSLFFVLAHELGHIRHGDAPSRGAASIAQELAADRYALDAMADVGLFPLGLTMPFAANALLVGYSDTHPMSGQRVRAIAADVMRRPQSFIDRTEDPAVWTPRILADAAGIEATLGFVDDPRLRALIGQEAASTQWDALAAACPG